MDSKRILKYSPMSQFDTHDEGVGNSDDMRENGGGIGQLTKGPWLPAEDALLATLVAQYGAREWSSVSNAMAQHGHHRLGKQCRERYAKKAKK